MRKFIYGPGIDEPICLIDAADGNAVYYYHLDGLGSVVALSDVNSVLVERYAYDVFGRPTIRDVNGTEIAESAFANPYLFTGRAYDAETALYYYRARYYDYFTGRFLQPDPTGYADGLNLYTYCRNNPANLVDPRGDLPHLALTTLGGAIGGFVGGGVSAFIGGGGSLKAALTGACTGAVGGAAAGFLVGVGVPPSVAGALGGTMSSGLGQLAGGKSLKEIATPEGVARLGIGAATGALGGYLGGRLGDVRAPMIGEASAEIIEASLTGGFVGIADQFGNALVDFSKTMADFLNHLNETMNGREKECP